VTNLATKETTELNRIFGIMKKLFVFTADKIRGGWQRRGIRTYPCRSGKGQAER
jgi:hypothetical protein